MSDSTYTVGGIFPPKILTHDELMDIFGSLKDNPEKFILITPDGELYKQDAETILRVLIEKSGMFKLDFKNPMLPT